MVSRPAFARRALWQRQTHRPHLQSGRRRQSDQPFPVDEYGHCRSGVFFAHRQTSRVMAGALSRATLAADCRTGGKPARVKIPAPQAGRSVGLRYDRVVNQARRIRLMLRTGASRPLKAKRAFPSSSASSCPVPSIAGFIARLKAPPLSHLSSARCQRQLLRELRRSFGRA